mgnify:CR=1 FL=1
MFNSRTKQISKVVSINIIIIGIFLFLPALFFQLYLKLKPLIQEKFNYTSDLRSYYPIYSNKEFSTELINEIYKVDQSIFYRSFIGWKREKQNLKYTNISGPYNVRKSKGESINNSIWFFGGSTMWGHGASDIETIPSHFNSLTNMPVYNFGETSWNSRQSLNQLINAIGDNHKPSAVIFYDGVNNVVHNCRSEIKSLPAHSREIQIQNALKPFSLDQKRIASFILSPYIALNNKLNIQLPVLNQVKFKNYDCDINQAKARLIAQHLLNDWYTAYVLSRSKGFEFYGILQPTIFTTKTNSDYFTLNEVKTNSEREKQYRIVYLLIREEIEKRCESDKDFCSSIIDGTDWLDGLNNIFLDFCHINSPGNKVIAQRIKSLLKK